MHLDLSGLGDSALRLGLALLLGCAIGFERQWHQKMAGLRTNALVALGASGFVVFSGLAAPLALVSPEFETAGKIIGGVAFVAIGFALYLPFLAIDLAVAAILMGLGMMMLSPVLVALPFKLMLFVLADGWNLLLGSLAASFAT